MIALLLALSALAAEDDGLEVGGGAELRAVETMPSAFALSEDRTLDWGPVVDTRLRLDGHVRGEVLRLELQGDVASGQLFGETWDLSGDERRRDRLDAMSRAGVVPRKASVGARLPWFDLEVGLTTSDWGLGIVANDGATDPRFGRSDFGDRVLRARLATAPVARGDERFPLYVVLAADRVVADDLAHLAAGDEAWQGVLALLYDEHRPLSSGATGPRRLGVYGVLRDQINDDRRTKVAVADLYADWTWAAADGPLLRAAAEGAIIVGRTEVARTYVEPDTVPVRQAGAAVQLAVVDREDRWSVHLDGAYASGDRAPDDDRVTDFRFDRDHAVGMVLFDEVIGALDLAALEQATDPALAAQPPDGVQTLAAEGSFHAAVAAEPAVEVALPPYLRVALGGVFAWSTSPIASPVETFRAGGVPTNHMGRPTDGRYLGSELDWAVGTREAAVAAWTWRPSLTLMGGHAWPSADLSGGVERVDHLLLVGRLRL